MRHCNKFAVSLIVLDGMRPFLVDPEQVNLAEVVNKCPSLPTADDLDEPVTGRSVCLVTAELIGQWVSSNKDPAIQRPDANNDIAILLRDSI